MACIWLYACGGSEWEDILLLTKLLYLFLHEDFGNCGPVVVSVSKRLNITVIIYVERNRYRSRFYFWLYESTVYSILTIGRTFREIIL